MTSRPSIALTSSNVGERSCVLIVDGDKVSQRAIELALAANKYTIEWARDGEAAFDIMRRTRVDVVIADSMLGDMPGVTLMRRTFELCGPGSPTFLFISADRANTTKLALLMTGANDFLIKPFQPDELRVRVQNLIEDRRRARAEAVRGVTGLAGDASKVSLPDILTMLELTAKTGIIHVSVGPLTGRFVLEAGHLTHSEIGNLVGKDAFFVLLQYHSGVYRFEPGATDARKSMGHRVSQMLLAAAVREDSARNERLSTPLLESTVTSTAAGLRELGIEKRSIDLRSSRSATETKPPALTDLTTRLGIAIADPYLLGDLVLAEEIAITPTQFRIELWATQGEGVAALLALASPPGYQVLTAALQRDLRRLHVQFEASTASIIITLVDLEASGLPEVIPHGIVLVPPRGELVALSPQRLADIHARIEIPHKPVLIALGGPALHVTLDRIVHEAGHGFRYLAMPAKLDDARDVIGGLIRLWNASR